MDKHSYIRKKIREVLKEISSKKEINDLSDLILLSKSTLDRDGGTFLIYNPKTKSPIGYISFGYYPPADVYSVNGAYSEHGYGPLLYEMAMTYVYPNGISLSQDGGTSGDALYVWSRFEGRNDVKKEPINRTDISDKEKDLIGGCDGNEDCLEDVQKIIDLHNTKFIYSGDKNNLQKIIKIGKDFAKENNISDDDIEYMLWDLE